MKLAYILFLQICLLTTSYSYSNCTVNRINKNVVAESTLETLTNNTPNIEKGFIAAYNQLGFILFDDISEKEKYSSCLSGFPLNLNTTILKDSRIVYTKSIKLNNQGLVERNIIPYLNISRNILFHSLQIHF